MKIYNSLSRQKEEFVPIKEGKVSIYSCGPTVYDYFHIGNARPFIVFDTLRRYFEYKGLDVTFIQNFTDIDDKMIKRANKENITVKDLGERFIKEYFIDADALNIKRATVHPKATESIDGIIKIIQTLIEKDMAYEVKGDVYYSVEKFKDYGKLSGQNLEELNVGSRVDVDEDKKNPMDFALWKAKKEDEPFWQSPFGEGRPGWHIECSAMCMDYLGETLDIHCGGHDLTFPHHENDIAQSDRATAKKFVNYRMHNGYININGEKMSKSLGNFFTVRDISKEFDLAYVRMFMLSSHYRSQINFSKELIMQSKTALDRIKTCYGFLSDFENNKETTKEVLDMISKVKKGFETAMDDDLNTADALGVIFEYVREVNTYFNANPNENAKQAKETLYYLCDCLGLDIKDKDSVPKEVIELCEMRIEAKKAKDFKAADELRDKITALGYTVKDGRDGYKVVKN